MADAEDKTPSLQADSKNPFSQVPIEITISVGRARPLIRELLQMGENAILPLARSKIRSNFMSATA